MLKSKSFIALLIGVFVILGVLFVSKIDSNKTLSGSVLYVDNEYPLLFSYNNGLDKYAFFVDKYINAARKSEPNLLRMVVLVEEGENQKLVEDIKNDVAREGPRGITIFVINNQEKLTVINWLKQSPISNFGGMIGETTETTIGGNPALSYKSDGLYTNETVVAEEGNYIYVFNVTFNSVEDNIYKDFQTLLATVQL